MRDDESGQHKEEVDRKKSLDKKPPLKIVGIVVQNNHSARNKAESFEAFKIGRVFFGHSLFSVFVVPWAAHLALHSAQVASSDEDHVCGYSTAMVSPLLQGQSQESHPSNDAVDLNGSLPGWQEVLT